jgi:hypothetical protein
LDPQFLEIKNNQDLNSLLRIYAQLSFPTKNSEANHFSTSIVGPRHVGEQTLCESG